jgi:galactokinase
MSLILQTVASYYRNFSRCCDLRTFKAPGRVNLIGDHTDYNDGFVLPAAIDRHIVVAATARDDSQVNVYSRDFDAWDHFDFRGEITRLSENSWGNYIRGIVWALLREGFRLKGMDAAVAGDIPIGAGLSSSAAMEVVCGYAMLQLSDKAVDRKLLALAAQKAENDFVGMRCGIMDQYISCFGRRDQALLIDCRKLTDRALPIPSEVRMVIVDSGVHRGLVEMQYNKRRKECETAAAHFGVAALRDVNLKTFESRAHELVPVVRRRARHVVTENDRTLRTADALQVNDLKAVGNLMKASHASLRDDFDVSCPELDSLVKIALGVKGVYGARLTGAGFGGSMVALVKTEAVPDLRDAILKRYDPATGRQASVHVCSASNGVLEVTIQYRV